MAYSSSGYGNPFGMAVTPWVKRLLIANLVVFLVTLALPVLEGYLAFRPMLVLTRPWTLVTYMFVHAGFWHLLGNMLGLFFFGGPLEERWGSREFLKFYLITGLAGALLSFVFVNAAIVGASAAVYGIMLAFALYWPDNPVYIWGIFPVKVKWLVAFLIGISVLSAVTGSQNGTAHLAHLGGAAAAFLYLKSRAVALRRRQQAAPPPQVARLLLVQGGGQVAQGERGHQPARHPRPRDAPGARRGGPHPRQDLLRRPRLAHRGGAPPAR
jgi:membrane associated rhomboid family serine protease